MIVFMWIMFIVCILMLGVGIWGVSSTVIDAAEIICGSAIMGTIFGLILFLLVIPNHNFEKNKTTFYRPAPIEYYDSQPNKIKFIVRDKLYVKTDIRYLNTNNIVERVEHWNGKTNVKVMLGD